MNKTDLIGRRFTRLVVLGFENSSKRSRWLCVCDCGNKHIAARGNLITGSVKSCGCLNREKSADRFRTHGLKNTPEYVIWKTMKQRCYYKKHNRYQNYGGRGIAVCDRWLNSYESFLKDMGRRPDCEYSLDRINNNGNYEPENCRWATAKEQANNRRKPNSLNLEKQ